MVTVFLGGHIPRRHLPRISGAHYDPAITTTVLVRAFSPAVALRASVLSIVMRIDVVATVVAAVVRAGTFLYVQVGEKIEGGHEAARGGVPPM